jgi:hypothetical protein
VADRHLAAVAHQRGLEQSRLGERAIEQPLRRVAGHTQSEGLVPRAVLVDERGRAEALGEAPQLALGRRPLIEIDEVDGDAPLGEEALRLARVLAVFEPEDLDVDIRRGCR